MLLLGVTGSIAVYKAADLASRLTGRGVEVRVVMTPTARRFVGEVTFEGVTGHRPVTDEGWFDDPMAHIRLTDAARLMLVAPCSAASLARLALGLSEGVLAATALAVDGALWVAPAMNARMWAHPATQAHVVTLRERGVKILGPETGDLACGHNGPGRMIEPEALEEAVLDSKLVT